MPSSATPSVSTSGVLVTRTPLLRGLEIDRIDTDAEHADDLELGQGPERHALGAENAVGRDAAHAWPHPREERGRVVGEPQLVHDVRFFELRRGARMDVDDLENFWLVMLPPRRFLTPCSSQSARRQRRRRQGSWPPRLVFGLGMGRGDAGVGVPIPT